MLPGPTLPASLAALLGALRPCFTAPSFATFCGLAAGLAGQVRRRTVCGMLLGAGLARAWPHDRAHYFFARARWQVDELGLAVARLVVLLLVPPGQPLTVAVDDSVFRRSGRKVHGAGWQYDGSAPTRDRVSFGTCFVTCGIVTHLPFCTRPVCLPVLARLVPAGKTKVPARARKTKKAAPLPGTKLSAAAELVTLLAAAFPGRAIDVVADAAYHGPALKHLPPAVTWTCRLRANAVLYDPAPSRPPGTRGRPRRKGQRLGTPGQLAATARWTPATVRAYGRDQAMSLADITCLWYGCLDTRTVRVILARDRDAGLLALVTTDLAASPPATPIARARRLRSTGQSLNPSISVVSHQHDNWIKASATGTMGHRVHDNHGGRPACCAALVNRKPLRSSDGDAGCGRPEAMGCGRRARPIAVIEYSGRRPVPGRLLPRLRVSSRLSLSSSDRNAPIWQSCSFSRAAWSRTSSTSTPRDNPLRIGPRQYHHEALSAAITALTRALRAQITNPRPECSKSRIIQNSPSI
jgi:hypothetical protein